MMRVVVDPNRLGLFNIKHIIRSYIQYFNGKSHIILRLLWGPNYFLKDTFSLFTFSVKNKTWLPAKKRWKTSSVELEPLKKALNTTNLPLYRLLCTGVGLMCSTRGEGYCSAVTARLLTAAQMAKQLAFLFGSSLPTTLYRSNKYANYTTVMFPANFTFFIKQATFYWSL